MKKFPLANVCRWLALGLLFALPMLTGMRLASAATFPTSGGNYTVNVLRHFNTVGQFTTGITGLPLGGLSPPADFAIDGGGDKAQWTTGAAGDPNATGSLQITLDTVYKLGGFRTDYLDPGYRPADYQIRVSTTGFGSMTTVVPFGSMPAQTQIDNSFIPTDARYIEYTWKGTAATQYVLVQEFQAYAATTNSFPITTDGGFDIVAMQNSGPNPVTATKLNGGAGWQPDSTDPASNIKDLNTFTYIRGNGNTAIDAQLLLDLGDLYQVGVVSLGFYQSQNWASGVKIETSPDNINFTVGYDTHAALASQQNIHIPLTTARYLRITDYHSDGGALTDVQVFIPEPTSALLLGLGSFALLARRFRHLRNA